MRILWTGLPHVSTENGLQLAVYVTPRLTFTPPQTQGTLDEFPRVRHWPEFVNQLEFDVEFAGGPTVPAASEPVDTEWWEKIFADDTPVNPFVVPDHSQTVIRSIPVGYLLPFIEGLYQTLAEQGGTELPSRSFLETMLQDLNAAGRPDGYSRFLDAEFEKELQDGSLQRALRSGHTVPGLTTTATAFVRAHRFYRRPDLRQPYLPEPDPSLVPDRPAVPQISFHEALTYLTDAPELLTMLGLVIPLRIEGDPEELGIPKQGTLRILPSEVDPAVDRRPRTKYEITADGFHATPRNPVPIEKGLLRLDFERDLFTVYQVDIDGAALKLVDFTGNLSRMEDLPPQTSPNPEQSSVPSLRSSGFTVAAHDRAWNLIASLDEKDVNSALHADLEADNADLGIEDLVRGFRLDVWDKERGRWFQLHARVGDHQFLGRPGHPAETVSGLQDEGYVKATAASAARLDVTDTNDPNAPGSDDLYLHEALFGWDGWSPAVSRPGKIIVEPGEGEGSGDPPIDREQQQPHPDFPIISSFRVKDGTLPRLRYGRIYRLRARIVDLAGNSIPFDKDDYNEYTTEEHRYVRYEPVAEPVIVRRHPDTEAESLEVMAIRSNDGISAEDYAQDPVVLAAIAGEEHTYSSDSQRHVAPPKTSVQMAELLGAFDTNVLPGGPPGGAFGSDSDPAEAYRVSLKEEGTFFDKSILDIATGQKTIDVSTDIKVVPASATPPQRGDAASPVYIYRPGPDLKLPYLPDPLAVGAAFYGLPGHETSSIKMPYQGDWPLKTPFRIRLVQGPADAELVDGELKVQLPQAERRRVRYSTFVDEDGRDKLALWNQMSESARSSLGQDVLDGRHWMMTPYRWLDLVHAVQQPLAEPEIGFTADKEKMGATYAVFDGTIANHAKSTSRLDVHASWSEPVDRVSKDDADPTTDRLQGSAIPFSWEILPNEDAADVNLTDRISRHEFGDTKHRVVTYHAVATTRFREYFPDAITSVPANIQRTGPSVDLTVPNSARPAKPEVLYVIPTFSWGHEELESGRRHRRRGGAVRVYLDRPWWSSGDGEQLGVVLYSTPRRYPETVIRRGEVIPLADTGARQDRVTGSRTRPYTESAKKAQVEAITRSGYLAGPYVTQWGKDPTWATGNPKAIARLNDFPLRTPQSRSGLSIAERNGATVAVAGHHPNWDSERGLWYCDIEMDPGETYFPFVRLALARYQPESISGAHLSPIVHTDFIQLTADRTATVLWRRSVARVSVTGLGPHNIVAESVFSGPFGSPGVDLANSRTVSAVLQEMDPDIGTDMGWRDVGEEVILPVASMPVKGGRRWEGDVDVPQTVRGNGTHRLLIREYEHFFTDFDPEEHPNFIAYVPGAPIGFTRSRVVYVDTFDI